MRRFATYKLIIACLLLEASSPHLLAQSITASDTMETFTIHGTYYSDRFVGRKTSSGEVFSQQKYTAAHHTLPFGTLLLVTNPANGRQAIVRINDRCPKPNILDMSRKAAKQIGIGSFNIQVTVLPQRYYPYWENQEQFLDVMYSGDFWEYAKTSPLPVANLVAKATPKQQDVSISKSVCKSSSKAPVNSTPKPSSQPTNKTIHNEDEYHDAEIPLYDIELCHCKSRNTARKKVMQMPIYYQDKVDYRTNVNTNEVIIILSLSLREDKTQSIMQELSGLFPDAKIVKSNLVF